MDRARPDPTGLSPRRLYCAALPAADARIDLGSEAAKHAQVLRLAVGDEVALFDGRGSSVLARVAELGRRSLVCVASGARSQAERGPRLVLVQCMPRGGKLDEIVRMTTEIGVSAIHLALSDRVVARSPGDRAEHKLERLERIAIEAARQAEQAYLPDMNAPRPLADVLREAPEGAGRYVLLERSVAPLPAELPADEAWIVVGPEGGFSERDRGEIASAGFAGVSLGQSILRTETAAVVGVALLAARLADRARQRALTPRVGAPNNRS
jgi:16S rRNA (uracil1498-N3)-methyltransferase